MPSVPSSPIHSSGITTSSSGDRHIPPSTRADGSTRKEIKIRPGYRPPEDVEVYKNRTAEAWKTRGQNQGVPGAEAADDEEDVGKSNKAGGDRNARRREARRRAKAAEDEKGKAHGVDKDTKVDGIETGNTNGADKEEKSNGEVQSADSAVEGEKQVRNLKKKLRQARDLREKKDQGQSLLPEQFEKVIKINELIRQLDSLGFDAEGEPKG